MAYVHSVRRCRKPKNAHMSVNEHTHTHITHAFCGDVRCACMRLGVAAWAIGDSNNGGGHAKWRVMGKSWPLACAHSHNCRYKHTHAQHDGRGRLWCPMMVFNDYTLYTSHITTYSTSRETTRLPKTMYIYVYSYIYVLCAVCVCLTHCLLTRSLARTHILFFHKSMENIKTN